MGGIQEMGLPSPLSKTTSLVGQIDEHFHIEEGADRHQEFLGHQILISVLQLRPNRP